MTALQAVQLARRTFVFVLAGGRGSRLKQLTDRRAKPAVYFGGKFRIIDFALSNCLNSGIRRIGVVTQYKSHSLMRHLQRGWSFLRAELNEIGRRCCRRSSASTTSTGTAARPTRCTRTWTSSRRARRRTTTSSCWPATTSTRWTTRSCWRTTSQHGARRAPSAASRCRAWKRCAFGVMAVDDDAPHHRLRREAGRPAADARPARRRAGQHGHLRLRLRVPVPAARGGQRRSRTRATISARTSSRSAVAAGPGAGASVRHVVRDPSARGDDARPTGATSARSMHSGPPTST